MTATTEEMHAIAKQVAASYARLCWWADTADMEQEAFAAIWRAQQTFDPATGVPFGGYAHRAAVLSVRRWLWEHSSPVATSTHRPEAVRGVLRAELSAGQVCRQPWPDALLEAKRRAEALNGRLETVLSPWPLAVSVLVGEEKSAAVARSSGAPVKEVYRQAAQARHAVRYDRKLWKMWRESA